MESVLGFIVSIILAVVVLVFFWGLAMYLFNAADREKRSEAVQIMLMSVLLLLIIVIIWAVVHTILGSLADTSGV